MTEEPTRHNEQEKNKKRFLIYAENEMKTFLAFTASLLISWRGVQRRALGELESLHDRVCLCCADMWPGIGTVFHAKLWEFMRAGWEGG